MTQTVAHETVPPGLPATLDAARPLLVGRALSDVGHALRLRELRLQGVEGYSEIAMPVVDGLYVGAVLDLPTSDVPVTTELLRRWDATHADVVDAATAVDHRPAVSQIGEVVVAQGAAFVGAALRRPALVDDLLGGRAPFVLVPAVDVMVVAPADAEDAVLAAGRIADRVLAGAAQPLTATPLARAGEGWAPTSWPKAVGAIGRAVRARLRAAHHARLRQLLQVHYDRTDEAAIIAEATVVPVQDGGAVTRARLVEGERTVLPHVDEVELVPADGAPRVVPFAAIAAIDGLLTPLEGTTPPLSYPTRFPAL